MKIYTVNFSNYISRELAERQKNKLLERKVIVNGVSKVEEHEIVERDEEVFWRVYVVSDKRYYGNAEEVYNGNDYDKARAIYESHKEDNYVELQLGLVNERQMGVTAQEDNLDEDYWDMYESYWARREAEEDNWRPGDAPWDAPGMSISDFF